MTEPPPLIVDVQAYPDTKPDASAPSTYSVVLSQVQHITTYRDQYGEPSYCVYLSQATSPSVLSTPRHRGSTDRLFLPGHHPFLDTLPTWVHITRASRREYL